MENAEQHKKSRYGSSLKHSHSGVGLSGLLVRQKISHRVRRCGDWKTASRERERRCSLTPNQARIRHPVLTEHVDGSDIHDAIAAQQTNQLYFLQAVFFGRELLKDVV